MIDLKNTVPRKLLARKKATAVVCVAALAITLLAGCSSPANTAEESSSSSSAATSQSQDQTSYPLTLSMWDGDGNAINQTYEETPERVICLTDSTAEIMCRLGLADKVIGTVTPEAPMPDDIASEYAKIPVLGDKKTLSREVIVGSDPDVILGRAMTFTAQNQTDPETYNGLGINLYIQTATAAQGDPTLQGVIDDVKNIAAIFDVEEAAEPLVTDMEERLNAIEKRVAEQPDSDPQKVLIMTNFNDGSFGLFGGTTGATLQFNLIEMMGAEMASTQSASGLTYENLIEFDPDVIIYVTAERNKETDATVEDTLYGEASLQSVPAIANKRIVMVPYAEFMDTTPRIFDAAEQILNALYPQS